MKALMKPSLRVALALLMAGGSASLLACKGSGEEGPRNARGGRQRATGPVPVRLAEVTRSQVPWRKRFVGRVVALKEHLLRPEGEGPITQVFVREGQFVRAGAPLVAMDPEPAREALARAQANLARARAQHQLAQAQAKRFSILLNQGFVSRAEADAQRTSSRATSFDVQAALAEHALATRALNRAVLRAPFSGNVQELRAVAGAWARPSDEGLMRLVAPGALELRASVPQFELADLRSAGSSPVARARLRGSSSPWVTGRYLGVDAALDAQSLAAIARVRFDGPSLPPGGFAELELTLPAALPAMSLPTVAIQQGQQGPFVYLAQDGKAVMKPVRILREADGVSALASGPELGSQVVVDGFARLAPDAEIQAVAGEVAPPPRGEGGRRRRGAEGDAGASGAEAGAAEGGWRRRRGAESEAGATSDAMASGAEEGPRRRRRREAQP